MNIDDKKTTVTSTAKRARVYNERSFILYLVYPKDTNLPDHMYTVSENDELGTFKEYCGWVIAVNHHERSAGISGKAFVNCANTIQGGGLVIKKCQHTDHSTRVDYNVPGATRVSIADVLCTKALYDLVQLSASNVLSAEDHHSSSEEHSSESSAD